nr:efflux RND transporter periplasmic adaptor subunit [Pandoraea captiosa]
MTPRAMVTALGILGIALLPACSRTDSGTKTAEAPEVKVVTLAPRTVNLSSDLPGRASAYMVAEVRPQVGGILLKRHFEEGSMVKAGQVLYQIDSAPFRAIEARAEASLDSARSLSQRYETLVKVHAVSQQQVDDARSQYLQAKAAAESARIDLGYTRITAPISGRIGRSSVTQGALLTANQTTALATVQQLDPIYVDIEQPAKALLQMKEELSNGQIKNVGGQAEIHLKLENGRTYPHAGKLKFSEVSVDASTGAVTLRAVFPNPEGALLPGMFVRAELLEGVREHAILVPQRAVSRDTQGNAVALIVDSQSRVQQRSLATDRAIDGQWLIRSGLQSGDRVIVDGLQFARPGGQVRPVDVSPPKSTGVSSPRQTD